MRDFYLVQRGSFTEETKHNSFLDARNGTIHLDNMKSSDFSMDEIIKAFCRIMGDYAYYDVYPTGIKNLAGEELMIFSRWDRAYELIESLREFTDGSSWELKEPSGLEQVKNTNSMRNGFWWCIDMPAKNILTDWMAFFKPYEYRFKQFMGASFNGEWKTKKEKEE